MSRAPRFETDRIQLLLETRFEDVEQAAVAMTWLIEAADRVGKAITGHSVTEQDVELSWQCTANGVGRWRSEGRTKRGGDLERFQRSLRQGSEMDAFMEWVVHIQHAGAIRIHCSYALWGTRPQLKLQWMWADRASIGLTERSEAALIDIAAELAAREVVAFLHLTDDLQAIDRSALDIAQGRMLPDKLVDPGMLRSYSWVTHLSPDQAAAVGGLEHLRASGVFHAIHAAGDGYLLQATEHLPDYAGAPVRAVRDALAAVIPSEPDRFQRDHLRLAWLDGTNGPLVEPIGNRIW